MTDQDKKRWLWRYQEAVRMERELVQELETLNARASGMTNALTGMPGGGGDGQKLPRAVEGIVTAKKELQAQIETCNAVRQEVKTAIEQVPDAREREVLRRRYLLGQRWENIAVETHTALRHVYRLHRAALKNVIVCH